MSTVSPGGIRCSPQQRHVWKSASGGAGDAYFVRAELSIEGPLDVGMLQAALDACVRRHEILRTTFRMSPVGELMQIVRAEVPLPPLRVEPFDPAAGDGAWPGPPPRFDLANGPVVDARLTKSSSGHTLVLSLPAMCADRVTLERLAVALRDAYAAAAGCGSLDPEPAPYTLISEWEHDLLRQEEARVGVAYWRRILADAPAGVRLPFEHPDEGRGFVPRRAAAALDARACEALEQLAAREGLPPSTVLAACWGLLLARVTGQRDVVLGVAFDGRTDRELHDAAGPLARVLPLAFRIDPARPWLDAARQVAESSGEAAAWQECFAWQEMPFDDPAGAEPFLPYAFDALEPPPAPCAAGGVSFALRRRYDGSERWVLRLTGEGGSLALDYDASRMEAAAAECLLAQVATLVGSALADPRRACGALEIAGQAERRRVLVGFNGAARSGEPAPVHEAVARRAAEAPDRIAIVSSGASVTFGELNARANRVAHFLGRQGVGPDDVVAIAAPRSPELVAAVLGILKAGAAFLPLDADWPGARIDAALAELAPALVLHGRSLAPDAPACPAHVLDLDADPIACQPAWDPQVSASPEQLAYVISTSGSTGLPKGAAVPHRALANHMEWMLDEFALGAGDVILQRTPIGFDASVWEVLAPLLAGARLALPDPEATFDVSALVQAIRRHGVTVLQVVPTLLRPLLDAPEFACAARSLRLLFSGGEALTSELHERAAAAAGHAPINLYGPAETCIQVIWWASAVCPAAPLAPLGRPIPNTRAYVLDEAGQPCPLQIAGDLYIGGAAVGRGYAGRPDLTAASFVPDPWSGCAGARMYRTGDRAWWSADGTLRFVGRDDDQVKVRGVRVELEEIRAALVRHPGVRECAVLAQARGGAQPEIVAYLEPAGPTTAGSEREWREHLGRVLPDVMVPARFVVRDRLPRSASGKIDRVALGALAAIGTRVPPRTPTEAQIVAVWREVLNTDAIGVEDNFFSLGGHSLLLTQVLTRLNEAFGLDLPLRALFDAPTVAGLAQAVDAAPQRAGQAGGVA